MLNTRFTAAFLLVFAGLTQSCQFSDQPSLHPVTGTVTYSNAPLANATVTFTPDAGLIAIGRTDASGKFSLKTRGLDGASAGTFTVTVVAAEEGKKYTPEEWDNLTDAERLKSRKSLIPERYRIAEDSGLLAEVTAGGENNFTFELTP